MTICYCKKQIDVSFSCVCSVIDNEFRHCQNSLWIHSYLDNVMTKFMIKNRADAWKTDVNLLNRASARSENTSGRNVHFPASFLFPFYCKSLRQKVDATKSVTIKVSFVFVVVLNAAVYDKHDYCPAWAATGECKKSNWTWMRDNCPLSCGIPREYLVHLQI